MARDKVSDAVVTEKIIQWLYKRHCGYEWACFCELRSGTGGRYDRTFDFWVMNTWPSKKYERIGYEVKVSRADFAKEIASPEKRDRIWKYSNSCYFVAPAGLIGRDEVPEGWGLIELVKNGLRRKKIAQWHEADLPVSFLASVIRESQDKKPRIPDVVVEHLGEELPVKDLIEIADNALFQSLTKKLSDAQRDNRTLQSRHKQQEKLARVFRSAANLFGFRDFDDIETIEKRMRDGKKKPHISLNELTAMRRGLGYLQNLLNEYED